MQSNFRCLKMFSPNLPNSFSPNSHFSLLYIVLWGLVVWASMGGCLVFGGREIVSQIGKIPREGRQSQVSPHFKSVLHQKFTHYMRKTLCFLKNVHCSFATTIPSSPSTVDRTGEVELNYILRFEAFQELKYQIWGLEVNFQSNRLCIRTQTIKQTNAASHVGAHPPR